jgi:hypothetical protein
VALMENTETPEPVGVPVICADVALNVSPAGRAPALSAKQ